MRPYARVLVLACAACTVLHLPSSTAAPISPPLVQAIGRAIASIIVQTAVSRGIDEKDARTTASLAGIQDVLTQTAEKANGFGRADPGLTWITLWMELGRSMATKLLAGNEHATVEVDPNGEVFRVNSSAPPPYPSLTAKAPDNPGDFKYERFFRAVQGGLRVFRLPGCELGANCDLFPPVTAVDWISAKYYQDQRHFLVLANSLDQVRQMATIDCEYWWGSGSGKKGTITEGARELTLGCADSNRRRSGPSSQFQVRQDKDSIWKMTEQPGVKDLPITADSMTQLVNALWKSAASKPDYKGIAFEPEKPIEAQTVQQWFTKEPNKVPTVQDLFSPARPHFVVVATPGTSTPAIPGHGASGVIPGVTPDRIPGTTGTHPGNSSGSLPGSIPGAIPGTQPGVLPSDVAGTGAGTVAGVGSVTGTGTDARTGIGQDVNVVNQPSVQVTNPVRIETGEVPQVKVPTLESTPTAHMILKPLLDLLPGFRTWQPPAHQAECPRPTFQAFEQTVRMDAMCDIAEKNRSAIHTSMMLVFALAALLIILSA